MVETRRGVDLQNGAVDQRKLTEETHETLAVQCRDNAIWIGVGKKDYKTILQDSAEMLAYDMHEVESGDIVQMAQDALAIAHGLYEFAIDEAGTTKNVFEQTHYHGGVAKPEKGAASHIKMVMANTVMIFATLRGAASNPEKLTEEEMDYLKVNYGEDWQRTILSLDASDLKQIIGYSAFHEAGEWWTRTVPYDKLEEYKDKVQAGIDEYFGDEEENKLCLTTWSHKIGNINNWAAALRQPHFKLPEDYMFRTGYVSESKGIWEETAFDVKLHPQAHKRDTNFDVPLEMDPNKREIGGTFADKKQIVKTRMVRAADLNQTQDSGYGELILINGEEVMKGPAILYKEMEAFMPHALVSYGWGSIEEAGINSFFLNTIVLEYNNSRVLLGMIDKTGLTGEYDYYAKQVKHLEASIKEPVVVA